MESGGLWQGWGTSKWRRLPNLCLERHRLWGGRSNAQRWWHGVDWINAWSCSDGECGVGHNREERWWWHGVRLDWINAWSPSDGECGVDHTWQERQRYQVCLVCFYTCVPILMSSLCLERRRLWGRRSDAQRWWHGVGLG